MVSTTAMGTNAWYLGPCASLLLACGSHAAPHKLPSTAPDSAVVTDDGLALHVDVAERRLSHLSAPGLELALDRGGLHAGVSLQDHEDRVLLASTPASVVDLELAHDTLRVVRESGDHGLEVTETWTAHERHIELHATIVDTLAAARGRMPADGEPGGRAIEACVTLPVDLVGKTWHHHLHQAEPIAPDGTYHTLLTEALDIGHWSPAGEGTHFKSELDFNLHGLNLIGDDDAGLAIAMHPDAPAAYYVAYDAADGRLSACFHLGIYHGHRTRPASTELRLVLFHVDEPRWGLRAALARYFELFPGAFRGRLPRQVTMTADGVYNFQLYPDPAAFHIGAMWNVFYGQNRKLGVKNFLYAWPTGYLDRGMRLGAAPVSDACADCDGSATAQVSACLAIYRDYEDGVLRFPQICADTWSQSRCKDNPLDIPPRLYGPVRVQGAFMRLRPHQVSEPTNLVLRLFGKFAMYDPISRSILRDAAGGHDSALSTARVLVPVAGAEGAYTCFINGINPDPGVGRALVVPPAPGEAPPEPPVQTDNFGELNLEIARRATGVYGPRYVHVDPRHGPMVYDGVAVDTVGAYLRPDFHPLMLERASLPLGYDRPTGRIVAMEHLSLTAFLGALRDAMPRDGMLAINGYPISGTLGQGVDVFVRELGRRWRKEAHDDSPRYYHELYDEDLATRLRRVFRLRMVAYRRSITFWARFTYTEERAAERGVSPDEQLLDDMQRYLPLYTAQGIYVFIQRTGIGARDQLFARTYDPAIMQAYERHLDTVRALTQAGWEPVPHVRVDDPAVLVERFGAGLITLYNGGDAASVLSAHIEWSALGPAGKAPAVRDFYTGAAVPVTLHQGVATVAGLRLAPNQVKILVLAPAPGEADHRQK